MLKLAQNQAIVVPQTVVDTYPALIFTLQQIGLTAFKPVSGFKSGIAYLRSWENELSHEIILHSAARFETVAPLIPQIALQASRLILEGPQEDAYYLFSPVHEVSSIN